MESYAHPSNVKTFVFDPKFAIPREIVDDVICRFLLNIPKEEKFDPIRVCFQIELAHWFFVDYYCGEGCSQLLAQLHNIPYNQFAYIMFQQTPHLKPRLHEIDKHLAAFREYKMRVPTYGAVLMNSNLTKVVLVQGFRNQWGFPKGKVNEVEEPVSCAIREVYEETGYDISSLVNANHFIESKTFERNDRLYLIRGVDMKFPFEPQTQFEIKNIKWFNIDELPEHKRDTNPAIAKHGVPITNFYTVYPYVKRLRTWIVDKLEGKGKIQNFKIRQENDMAEVIPIPSTQRPPIKPSQNLQQKLNIHKATRNQNPSQFAPEQFHSSTQGSFQLFPTGAGEQHSYIMNSNAIHELLLNSQLQIQNQQQRQGTSTTNPPKPIKNPRRRLFSEETASTSGKQFTKDLSTKRTSDAHIDTSILSSSEMVAHTSVLNRGSKSKTTSKKFANTMFNAPSWANFSFDRERVYKAFFTPSL